MHKPLRRLSLLVSVLLASAFPGCIGKDAETPAPAGNMVEVLVAGRRIDPGHTITREHLDVLAIPATCLAPDMVLKTEAVLAFGKAPSRAIGRGQLILLPFLDAAKPAVSGTVLVLVAKKRIPAGQAVDPAMTVGVELPEAFLLPDMIPVSRRNAIAGRRTTRDIEEGHLLLEAFLGE